MMQPVHQLPKVRPGDFLREPAWVGNVVKELSTTRVLKNDHRTWVLRAIFLGVLGFGPAVDQLDDVLVVEVLDNFDLIFQCL